eukprot:6518425-Alexandrium_andersonii.AAC.2
MGLLQLVRRNTVLLNKKDRRLQITHNVSCLHQGRDINRHHIASLRAWSPRFTNAIASKLAQHGIRRGPITASHTGARALAGATDAEERGGPVGAHTTLQAHSHAQLT